MRTDIVDVLIKKKHIILNCPLTFFKGTFFWVPFFTWLPAISGKEDFSVGHTFSFNSLTKALIDKLLLKGKFEIMIYTNT